jgi:hypothetical protein
MFGLHSCVAGSKHCRGGCAGKTAVHKRMVVKVVEIIRGLPWAATVPKLTLWSRRKNIQLALP